MKTAIIDLDGTLACIDHRLHHVTDGKKDWNAFFEGIPHDTPSEPIVRIVNALRRDNYEIVLCSGRPEKCRESTVEWLQRHKIVYSSLYMRADGDSRPDHIVKMQLLDGIIEDGFEPFIVIDDRSSVVQAWRERGLVCLQCAPSQPTASKDAMLILMVGPSGAGKSTFLKRAVAAQEISASQIVSSDGLRSEICGDFKDQTKNREVFAALHEIVKTRLKHGLKVVVDATNIRRKDRLALVDLAQGVSAVKYLVINSPLDLKIERGGWRNQVKINDESLIVRHENIFQSNLKDILKGDDRPNVQVIDISKPNAYTELVKANVLPRAA